MSLGLGLGNFAIAASYKVVATRISRKQIFKNLGLGLENVAKMALSTIGKAFRQKRSKSAFEK